MSWFRPSYASRCQNERLDQAERGLLASQANLSAEAEATAGMAVVAREKAETRRAELRDSTDRVREQSLHTGDALRSVQDLLDAMHVSAERRTQKH